MQIKDSVVWITGGTSGMGLATAKLLVEGGAKVLITARSEENGRRVEKELGENCMYVKADVFKSEELQNAVAAVMKKWGRLDVLFANAGGSAKASWCLPMKPTDESLPKLERGEAPEWEYTNEGPGSLEDFQTDVYLNLTASFDSARLAAYEMSKNAPNADGERGVIIFTSSISATKRHSPGFCCGYAAGKAGLTGLTKEIACNLAGLGIRANCILPGYFDTVMIKGTSFYGPAWLEAQIFPKTVGNPHSIAQMAAQFIENVFLNNVVVEVTGGYTGTVPLA